MGADVGLRKCAEVEDAKERQKFQLKWIISLKKSCSKNTWNWNGSEHRQKAQPRRFRGLPQYLYRSFIHRI